MDGKMPRLFKVLAILLRLASSLNVDEYIMKNARPTARVMVMGKLSKRPPFWKIILMAAIPAPIITPAFIARGMEAITLFASPVKPSNIHHNPSTISKASGKGFLQNARVQARATVQHPR